jgi:3-oxoacyl-[acyl-carrier protein] reductase
MIKNYLVIGGSSGIGLQLSNLLRQQNNNVTIASRSSTDYRFDALTETLDLSMLPTHLDGLAYCPGSINLKPFHRLTDQDFIDDYTLNVLGAIRTIRSTLPLLKNAEQSSSVVLFSTVAVSQGMSFHSSIASAKGALEGLAISLAAELAPKIRVNVIAPSLTETPLSAKLLSTEEKKKASGDRHPLKRIGTSADIAKLAAFLISQDSSWMTGQILRADGGMSTLRP